MDSGLKRQVHQRYTVLIQDRIDAFRDMISGLTEDAANDAKGSAGDKHETALSMMHIEQEKLSSKLSESISLKNILDKIDPDAVHSVAAVGSLVRANDHLLFLSAALPKITVAGRTIIALSPQSPLGSELLGSRAGDTFVINSTTYTIFEIC